MTFGNMKYKESLHDKPTENNSRIITDELDLPVTVVVRFTA
jgi:hypothetical protein